MAKNIVICCDGTGNQYGDRNTNVVKLFSVLPKSRREQLAWYDPGVGTFSAPAALTKTARAWTKLLGLAFGFGIQENVQDAYRYLMEHYEPQDRVFIFGFSRGAYAARALVALIFKCGLLERGNDNLVPYAFQILKREKRVAIYSGFRRTFSRRCGVHFLGLWDTVKSVGWVYNPLKLQFTRRNPIVKTIRHAVSIDERRSFYRQNLWGEPFAHQDVKQVWFAGVHSDVGGSYPERESGLSQIALQWMIEEAVSHGLLVDDKRRREVLGEVPAPAPAHVSPATPAVAAAVPEAAANEAEFHAPPDFRGPLHKSLHGVWWIPEILPKRYEDPKDDFKVKLKIPFGERRFIEEGALIHRSVVQRMEAGIGYAPPNLPQQYQVVEQLPAPEEA